MRYGVRQKLCVCRRQARKGLRNSVRFWLYLCIQKAVHFPLFFPALSMAPVQSKPLLDVSLSAEEELQSSLLWSQRATFSRTRAVSCSVPFSAILLIYARAESHVLSHRQEGIAGKGTRSDANEVPPSVNPNGTAQIATWSDQSKRFRIRIRCRIRIRAHGIMHYLFLLSRFLPSSFPYPYPNK